MSRQKASDIVHGRKQQAASSGFRTPERAQQLNMKKKKKKEHITWRKEAHQQHRLERVGV